MLSKTTVDAINRGVLNKEQMIEAMSHYENLILELSCHGEKYIDTINDIKNELNYINYIFRNR